MIVFEFDTDCDAKGLLVWYLATTSCLNEDKRHAHEIYNQLDAQASGLTEGV